MNHSTPSFPNARPNFATTHWSLIYAAGRGESTQERAALSAMCEAYWYPIYALVRRRGFNAQDALDLTQGFFARILEKRDFDGADPERGRFRSYLSGAMINFIKNSEREKRAAKRGGDQAVLSLDHEAAEDRYRLEATDSNSPEKQYDRDWALVLIDRALDALREAYRSSGKANLFEALEPLLTGADSESYATLAEQLGMKEGALKVAVHRLRKRFRAELQREIAQTVSDPSQVDSELAQLFEALG